MSARERAWVPAAAAGRLTPCDSTASALALSLSKKKAGWSIGRFWKQHTGWNMMRLMYIAFVQGHLIDGLTSWPDLPAHLTSMLENGPNQIVEGFLIDGRAYAAPEQQEGGQDRQILDERSSPEAVIKEIQVRRLKRYQAWATDLGNHTRELTDCFRTTR